MTQRIKNGHNSGMENIRNRIKSDAIDKNVNIDKQNRHIRGSGGYVDGRSYLFDGVDAQALVDKYHGMGILKDTRAGKWSNKEFITLGSDIGVHVDPDTGIETVTNSFAIHYGNSGTHIVPSRRV